MAGMQSKLNQTIFLKQKYTKTSIIFFALNLLSDFMHFVFMRCNKPLYYTIF